MSVDVIARGLALGLKARITGTTPPLTGGVSSVSAPTITGSAPPLSEVELFSNGVSSGKTMADAQGGWSFTLPSQPNGAYALTALTRPASNMFAFSINNPNLPLSDAAGLPARFDLDRTRGLYYANGTSYGSESALVVALGGVVSGAVTTFGPFIDPTGTSILVNGSFDAGTASWAAYNGGTIAVSGGELVFTAGGSLSSFSQGVAGYGGRAFRYRISARLGTSANAHSVIATINNAALSAGIFSANVTSTTASNFDVYISTAGGVMTWFGGRNSGAVGTGTAIFDNATAVEAWPFQGFPNGTGNAVLIEATTPATVTATQVVYQGDADTERDRVRLAYGTDTNLHLIVSNNNNVQADINLGAVPVATPFKVAWSLAQNALNATLNGANCLNDPVVDVPGHSKLRIGRSFTGDAWAGAIARVGIVAGPQPTDWLEYQTAPATARWTEGDSYMAGAGGFSLTNLLETAASRIMINSAVGGSTLAMIRDRIVARSYLRARPLLIWDGSANSYGSVAATLALYDQIVQWKGDNRFLIIPSVAVGPSTSATPTAYTLDMAAIRDGLIAAYGAVHVFDALPTIWSFKDGSANDQQDVDAGVVQRSALIDSVHMNGTVLAGIANAVVAPYNAVAAL